MTTLPTGLTAMLLELASWVSLGFLRLPEGLRCPASAEFFRPVSRVEYFQSHSAEANYIGLFKFLRQCEKMKKQ